MFTLTAVKPRRVGFGTLFSVSENGTLETAAAGTHRQRERWGGVRGVEEKDRENQKGKEKNCTLSLSMF